MFETVFKHADYSLMKWINKLESVLQITITPFNSPLSPWLNTPQSGTKLISAVSENKNLFLNMVKDIRKSERTTFMATVITAFGKALEDYISKVGCTLYIFKFLIIILYNICSSK